MTQLEEWVWASVFAHAWEPRAMRRGETFQQWTETAIQVADHAVLELRTFEARQGRLHTSDELEAERRTNLNLPEQCEWCGRPVDDGRTHGENECFDSETGEPILDHSWVDRDDYKVCVRCGVVKQAEGNKPCRGRLPKIGLRGTKYEGAP